MIKPKGRKGQVPNLTLDNMCTSYLRLSILRQVFQIEIIAKQKKIFDLALKI